MKEMNKKGNALFHKGAYMDALRRLAFPAAVVSVLICIVECAYMIKVDRHHVELWKGMAGMGFADQSFARMSWPMLSIFLVVSPLMLLFLFLYQNKRTGSDCFHSLPLSKRSQAFSSFAAVLTMDAAVLVLGGLIVEVMAAILPYLRIAGDNTFFITLGCCFAASVFTTALMLLALSLSGTWLSALCMYAILLVVPRLILLVGEICVFDNNSTIPQGLRGTILDRRLNVVTSLLGTHLSNFSYPAIKSFASLIYTLILGILIFVLAVYLHGRRASETAEHAAVSERVQAIFRTLLGCAVCLIPVALILGGNSEWKSIILLFLLAVAVSLLYEIILTRSLHECIKALPGILYMLLFCVVFVTIVWYGKGFAEKDMVSAGKVHSISMTYQPNGYYSFSDTEDYYWCEMRDYKITDREVIDILCEALNKEVLREPHDEMAEGIRLVFDGGVFFKERYVAIDRSDLDHVLTLLGKDSAYRDIFLKPVDKDDISSIMISGSNYTVERDSSDFDKVYELYCEGVDEYGDQNFTDLVSEITGISTRRMQAALVTLKDGRKQLVIVYDHEADREPDALTEAVSDYTEWEREKDLAETVFPEGGHEGEVAESYVMVEFYNIRPEFTKGTDLDEAQAALLSSSTWITHMDLKSNGWDRSSQSETDILFDKKIREMTKHMHFWSGWEVTDTSAPYMMVTYQIVYTKDGEPTAVKDMVTEYRIEEDLKQWLTGK